MKFFLLIGLALETARAFAGAPVTLVDGKYLSNANWPAVDTKASYQNEQLKKIVLIFPDGQPLQMSCEENVCRQDYLDDYNYYVVILSSDSFLLKEDRWALESKYSLATGH